MDERNINIQIVYIKGMGRQLQPAVTQKLRAVNNRMHQEILSLAHMAHIAPGKHLILHKRRRIFHDLFAPGPFFFIDKIGNQHIQRLLRACDFTQRVHDSAVCFFVHPVIAVYHLKKQPAGICDSGIDRLPVPAVFLMDCFYDTGVFFLVRVCDFRRHIMGTVIDNNNFHIIAAWKQGFDAPLHIILRIVARYRN